MIDQVRRRSFEKVSDLGSPTRKEKVGKSDFASALKEAVTNARNAEENAELVAGQFLDGKTSIHKTMIAHEKASIALRFAVNVKNRAVDAYRELMNTPV